MGLAVRSVPFASSTVLLPMLLARSAAVPAGHAGPVRSMLNDDCTPQAAAARLLADFLNAARSSAISKARSIANSLASALRSPSGYRRAFAVLQLRTASIGGSAAQSVMTSRSKGGRRGGIIYRLTSPAPLPTTIDTIMMGEINIDTPARAIPASPWAGGALGVATVRTV